MSLYRKYRPQNFSNLVGQDHVRITLLNALKTQNVNHAYLFTGPRGTGKTSTARLLAKAINCQNPRNAEPCEECEICRDITEGRLMDLIEIDAASNRGIDEIRDLREKIQFSPTRAKNKVYIIDEVHMLTKEAFNALLKTLEEPPERVYFILATTEVHKIPETILSRCQRFDFKRIESNTLLQRLHYIAEAEQIKVEESALNAIIHHAEGGLRDAIGLFEQLATDGALTYAHVQEVLGISGKASIEKLYHLLQEGKTKAGLEEIGALYGEGYDLVQFNKDFLAFLRVQMLQSVENQQPQQTSRILKLIELFQHSYDQLKHSTIPQLPLEVAVVESCLGEYTSQNTQNIIPQSTSSAFSPLPLAPSPRSLPSEESKPSVEASPPSESAPSPQPLPQTTPTIEQPPHRQDIPKAEEPNKSVTLEEVRDRWHKVVGHMKVPAAKRLFIQLRPSALRGHELVLAFQTNFAKEKMMEATNLLDLEQALAEVCGVHFKIIGEVATVKPMGEDHPMPTEKVLPSQPTTANAPQSPPPPTKSDQTDQLLEIFGGEIIEE